MKEPFSQTLPNLFPILHISMLVSMCLSVFVGCNPHPIAGEVDALRPSSYQRSSQLSSQHITDFAEDALGYIWIATSHGLNRYDGMEYLQYLASSTDTLSLPDNQVNCLLADPEGGIWIGTNSGLCFCDDKWQIHRIMPEFITSIAQYDDKTILVGNIFNVWSVNRKTHEVHSLAYQYGQAKFSNAFAIDNFKNVWTVTGHQVSCLDWDGDSLQTKIRFNASTEIHDIIIKGNWLFLTTTQGIEVININTRVFDTSSHPFLVERQEYQTAGVHFFDYDSESFLIASSQGLSLYNANRRQLIPQTDAHFPFLAPSEPIRELFIDSHHNVWSCSEQFHYEVQYNRQIQFSQNSHLAILLKDRFVTNLHFDEVDNRLFICIGNRDIYSYDDRSGLLELGHDFLQGNETVNDMLFDKVSQTLWIVCTESIVQCSLKAGHLVVRQRIEAEMPLLIVQDADHDIWVGSTSSSLHRIDNTHAKMSLETFSIDSAGNIMTGLLALPQHRLLIGDMNHGFYIYNTLTREAQSYPLNGLVPQSVAFNCFYYDHRGNIWTGSLGAGIFCTDLQTAETTHLNQENYCSDINSIIEDAMGYLWFGSYDGLIRYDRTSGHFHTFYKEDGIQDNEFSLRAAQRTSTDHLLFGGVNGITGVEPSLIVPHITGQLLFDQLTLNGRPALSLSHVNRIDLPASNSAIRINYTTLEYGNSHQPFQYRMEGFDPLWNSEHAEGFAYYSHLPVGSYTFCVRIVNEAGRMLERQLAVVVHPPLWRSPWMLWFVYPLLLLLIGTLLVNQFRKYRRHRHKLHAIIKEREAQRKANETNMRFFSNIAHEFRTPLTLILGAVNMQQSKDPGSARHIHLTGILQRNTQRLLRLVNQLMDFNKMEEKRLQLQVSPTDVVGLTRDIIDSFEVSLRQHQMKLSLELPSEALIMPLDADKYEKVMVNLLSNAIKYSPEGESLQIRLSTFLKDSQSWLQLQVADTGNGIPEDKRESIFGRFYQLESKRQAPTIGTGIGLYYVRSLVELHHGSIVCTGNTPRGSIFTVHLPMAEEYYAQDLKAENDSSQSFVTPSKEYPGEYDSTAPADVAPSIQSETLSVLTVVDDDSDVLDFLRMLLEPYYRLHLYSNATEALRQLPEDQPQLILSDVMMEGMDGYTFCSKVKEDDEFCHLPVILLTAKTNVEEQVMGLDCGATAYITKPFSPEYLLAMIRTQLRHQQRRQQIVSQNTDIHSVSQQEEKEAPEVKLDARDEEFLKQLYAFMEQHLEEPELDMDTLLRQLLISRSKLFYKVKALTNQSPNSFFKVYKLNRAADMIMTTNYKLAYIATATGFSSPSHFSSSFKKQFNCSPGEYKETRRADENNIKK